MEGVTGLKSFNDGLSRSPIFNVSFTQQPNTGDTSFSSYLRPERDEPTQDRLRCTIVDSEISIFDALKYFNDTSDQKQTSKRVSPITDQRDLSTSVFPRFPSASSSVDGYGSGNGENNRTRSFHATPTASSEASWNSQTGLLSHPPGAIAVSMRNPSSERKKIGCSSSRWFFRRNCPCSSEKSIQVEEKQSEPKSSPINKIPKPKSVVRIAATEVAANKSRRYSPEHIIQENQQVLTPTGFTFPILNSSPSISKRTEDPPRQSIEVHRPLSVEPLSRKSAIESELQRIDRQSFTFTASPKHRTIPSAVDDDAASDASSDLFEIESFSTQTTSYRPTYNHRDSLEDGLAIITRRNSSDNDPPTECYEPSEASIDWSVTTAEFSTTGSEVVDMARLSSGRWRGNGLLGCQWVNMGPQPVRYENAPSTTTATAATAATVMRHVISRPSSSNKPPTVTSRTASLSLAFQT